LRNYGVRAYLREDVAQSLKSESADSSRVNVYANIVPGFYQLHQTPITCPKCETVFEPPKAKSSFEGRPEPEADAELPVKGPEFVPLEHADPDAEVRRDPMSCSTLRTTTNSTAPLLLRKRTTAISTR
jgi:hypothetical protein